jgi:hypothetical protein
MQKIVAMLLWVAILVVALFVIVTAIGMALPAGHVVSRTLTLQKHAPPVVYYLITDFSAGPRWRSGLVKVEKLQSRMGMETWKETYQNGDSLTLRTTAFSIPNYLVREIADVSGPFSGRWEYHIMATENGGSTVAITEYGTVRNPFFRFMSKYVIGQTGEIDKYMTALANALQEQPKIS